MQEQHSMVVHRSSLQEKLAVTHTCSLGEMTGHWCPLSEEQRRYQDTRELALSWGTVWRPGSCIQTRTVPEADEAKLMELTGFNTARWPPSGYFLISPWYGHNSIRIQNFRFRPNLSFVSDSLFSQFLCHQATRVASAC